MTKPVIITATLALLLFVSVLCMFPALGPIDGPSGRYPQWMVDRDEQRAAEYRLSPMFNRAENCATVFTIMLIGCLIIYREPLSKFKRKYERR